MRVRAQNVENGIRRNRACAVAEAPKYLACLAEGKTARLAIRLFFLRGRVSHELISRSGGGFCQQIVRVRAEIWKNGFRANAVAEVPKPLASLAEGKTARLTIRLFCLRGRVSHELILRSGGGYSQISRACESPKC